ncbi:maleylpyruvate isomerase family mycothiol-dependent enzyme [Gordonia hydrophobica]|uniref:Maleylpyruvate isomerase family mycothiol-dependent enzyme n=1 Tax=Gordonia hydrophobica TaxID=40516 RepID=A0ABZ2U0X6_9ACTN|nr:maleylpyruvate isomerase family mycothiol-dependent enzyme [Gordonia hydrophobica]MBM7367647.1 uncharacterized protein (TIGR03083 family) [Gordonia hydrophobica]
MTDTELWRLVDDQRARTAEMFASLARHQWAAPSLCDGWTVREVGAHLTLQSMGLGRTLRVALRHPGTINRVIDASSRSAAARLTTDEIVERLRRLVGVHRPNAFTSVDEALVDAVVHTLDVTEPLGIDAATSDAAVHAVLDRLAGYHRTGRTAVFRPVATDDRRFVASDLSWSWGSGSTVEAPGTTLLLVLSGRRPS